MPISDKLFVVLERVIVTSREDFKVSHDPSKVVIKVATDIGNQLTFSADFFLYNPDNGTV